jgi:alkylation response protein AidB-like acyl-CoA dehydrogenase
MSYQFTEEQKLLQQNIRNLVRDKIAPGAIEREEKGEFPWDMVELLRQHNLFAIWVPEEYGGVRAGCFERCIVTEELQKGCGNTGAIWGLVGLGSVGICYCGNEAQKVKFLPKIAKGELLCALAISEPDAGSDVASIRTKAVRDGDEYVLNGTKRFISNADVAGLVTLLAKTDVTKGRNGISAFLIELDQKAGTPAGYKVTRWMKKLSMHCVHTCDIALDDLRISRDNLLGEENGGFAVGVSILCDGRLSAAAGAVGRAQGALDYALSYAKQRVAFGQAIAKFQAIRFMLADMATQTEAARQLLYMAAAKFDRGEKNSLMYSSMAKLFATDMAMKVTTDAIQILGGYGFDRDYPVQQLWKDSKAGQIYEGTNQIQRIVIAQQLLGKF